MTDFTWTFTTFEVALSEDGLTNVVKTINWTIRGNDNGVIDSVSASTGLGAPDVNSYTDYNDITEQWAIDAISSVVDIEAIKAGIQASIDHQKKIVRKTPPFLMPQPEQNANN